jgi:hypothetical protein
MTPEERAALNKVREDARRLVPEVREHLAGLGSREMPMSFDNWACMVGTDCDRFMRALCFVDKELFHAYMERRRQIRRDRYAAIAATTSLAERKKVAAEFDVTLDYVHKCAQQLRTFIRKPLKWEVLVPVALAHLREAGGSLLVAELAQKLGLKKARIYTEHGRAALEKVCDFELVKIGRSYHSRISIKPEDKDARHNRKRSR